MQTDWEILVVGGGASACFFAANLGKELGNNCLILEQGKQLMPKVKISGGGRCNVTHACFDPTELVEFFPRGNKELRSVFSKFQPGDTFEWFENKGVELKVEQDNRVFPITDSSQTVIDCITHEMGANGVTVAYGEKATHITKAQNGYTIQTKKGVNYSAKMLVLASGGNAASWHLAKSLSLEIIPAVPSLFTFNINDPLLEGLQGTSFANCEVHIPELKNNDSGPMLITHWGLSGPAILKLSAWEAIELNKLGYNFNIEVNFLGISCNDALKILDEFLISNRDKQLKTLNPFGLNKRFWQQYLRVIGLDSGLKYKQLNPKQLELICKKISCYALKVNGKSTYKDEFVTAGGIDCKEIDFRSMRVKKHENLFALGELINIDAVTGGFNFQACWSEAWIAATALAKKLG